MTPAETAAMTRASGYLELGLPDEALIEIDEAFPQGGLSPDVLKLRTELLAHLKRWDEVSDICRRMVELVPGDAFWWIKGAYATRRGRSIVEAEGILREGLAHHPREPIVVYNLACYACVQGRLDEAIALYGRAIALDERHIYEMSLRDPDLEPLHDLIRTRFKSAETP